MSEEIKIPRRVAKEWMGWLLLAIGIYCLSIYFNVIPVNDSELAYGRWTILAFALWFLLPGVYIVYYYRGNRKIAKAISKPLLWIIYAAGAIMFNAIVWMDLTESINNGNLLYALFVRNIWLGILGALLFDLIPIYVIVNLIRKRRTKK